MNRTKVLLVGIVLELLLLAVGVWLAFWRWQGMASFRFTLLVASLFALAVFVPMYVRYRKYERMVRTNTRLALRNERLALRNERMALQVAETMVNALDGRDTYTARHSAAVAQWATDLAEALHLSPNEVNVTRLAGLLHDVGKVGIPNEILLRDPANLSAVESVALKNHCRMGEAILNPIEGWSQLAMVVLYHHERYDGTGYPTGAAGEEIPLISRIISVADSYSLMVSDKPYRAKLSPEMAKSELAANRGTQFDPLVVDAFLALLERHDDDYQRGEQVDFNVEFQKVKLFRELPPEPEEPGS